METKIELNPNALKQHSVEALTADFNIPKYYANGFQSQLTLADANVIMVQNNVPVAVLVTTLVGIKSLRDQLNQLIKTYEESIGDSIPSFDELLKKAQQKAKLKTTNAK
jgi:hypothetical protein